MAGKPYAMARSMYELGAVSRLRDHVPRGFVYIFASHARPDRIERGDVCVVHDLVDRACLGIRLAESDRPRNVRKVVVDPTADIQDDYVAGGEPCVARVMVRKSAVR